MPASSVQRGFQSTRWSIVRTAQSSDGDTKKALQELCQQYWPPVYAYVRRRGYQANDAADLTQDLFTNLLAREGLASVDEDKGRFRCFLLAAAKNLLAEYQRSKHAQKRGGAFTHISIDGTSVESQLAREAACEQTPEQAFDQGWAKQLIADTLRQLDELNQCPERVEYYQRLRNFIANPSDDLSYANIALELNVAESALRVQVHRLRKKFRELLRRNVADTLTDPSEVDEELRYLLHCLTVNC